MNSQPKSGLISALVGRLVRLQIELRSCFFPFLPSIRRQTCPEHAYREMDLGGYSVAMPLEASETLFSPTTLLWIVVSAMAAVLLFGSINRRRSRLTDTLRDYVGQEQDGREADPRSGANEATED